MALGTESLKKFIKAGFNLGEGAAEGLKDKKISFFEAIGLLPELFEFVGAIKSWNEVKAELEDGLTYEEKLDLREWASNEFDIPNDKVEVIIEKSVLTIVTLVELAFEIKNMNNDTEEEEGTDVDL